MMMMQCGDFKLFPLVGRIRRTVCQLEVWWCCDVLLSYVAEMQSFGRGRVICAIDVSFLASHQGTAINDCRKPMYID
jgi:hypothetical protein